MGILARCACAAFLVALPGAACGSPFPAPAFAAAEPGIAATFIQYQDWMMKMDDASWRLELDAMRKAGIGLLVIQWLQFENTRFVPADSISPDPTRIILDIADAEGMKVFVGLAFENGWYERLEYPPYLDRAGTLSLRLASIAWARYGAHPSFAGWYIPQELPYAEYRSAQVEMLRRFYRRQADGCRALSGNLPVAVAPYFMERPPLETFRRVFHDIFDGSGISVVMLQDGVGSLRRAETMDLEVVPYFRAMREVCRSSGIELWSDIEIFEHDAGHGSVPAPIERIRRQLAAESPYVTSFIMFDFFHYMSPSRGAAQGRLYEDYLREVRAGRSSR